MSPNDRKPFAELIQQVYAYYRVDYSPAILSIWWGGLQQFDLPAIQDALGRHAANPDTGQFLPKIADVVRMIEGSTLDAAMVAWSRVDEAFRRVGVYQSVTFDDPITMRVLHDMGGWAKHERTTEDEWVFVGKEFQKRYAAFRARSERPDCPTYLPGLTAAQNAPHGFRLPTPVLIGNQARAAAIANGAGMAGLTYAEPTRVEPKKIGGAR